MIPGQILNYIKDEFLTCTFISNVGSCVRRKHFFRSPFFPIRLQTKDIAVSTFHNWLVRKCTFKHRIIFTQVIFLNVLGMYISKSTIEVMAQPMYRLSAWISSLGIDASASDTTCSNLESPPTIEILYEAAMKSDTINIIKLKNTN